MRKYVTMTLIEREATYLKTAASLLHGGSLLAGKEMAEKIEWLIGITTGAVEITSERDALLKQIKELEDAGNELESYCCEDGAVKRWHKAKKDKP